MTKNIEIPSEFPDVQQRTFYHYFFFQMASWQRFLDNDLTEFNLIFKNFKIIRVWSETNSVNKYNLK